MKKIICILCSVLLLIGCTAQPKKEEKVIDFDKKITEMESQGFYFDVDEKTDSIIIYSNQYKSMFYYNSHQERVLFMDKEGWVESVTALELIQKIGLVNGCFWNYQEEKVVGEKSTCVESDIEFIKNKRLQFEEVRKEIDLTEKELLELLIFSYKKGYSSPDEIFPYELFKISETPKLETTAKPEATPIIEGNPKPTSEPSNDPLPQKENSSSMTMGQKNALSKAKSYLSYSAFSYQGLIEQLEYEKYSYEDAVYAVDNCGADWNNQALKKAKDYLSYSSFSYLGLIEQLEFEGFTNEQASYGVDNCNADWYEQAVKKAASYLSHSSFSKEGLIEQLEFEGFTNDQAVHGVEANGY